MASFEEKTSGPDSEQTSETGPGLEERVALLESERDEAVDHLKRVAADFDNSRKRAARDQARLVARAHEKKKK